MKDYSNIRCNVFGITAQLGAELRTQSLMNPEIDLVTILGQPALRLLTLAAALNQTLDHKRYNEIIMTLLTVPG